MSRSSSATHDVLRKIISNLIDHEKFDHRLDQVEIKETNISYILLTGEYVYKFKKAVNLGFLDFTDLKKRHFYCEEEIRLNYRLAPELYLGVIHITGTDDQPEINGSGAIIEYAVKMRQFQKDSELDHLLRNGLFKTKYVHQLSETVAGFHDAIHIANVYDDYGNYDVINYTVFENINDLAELIREDNIYSKQLKALFKWIKQKSSRLKASIIKRKKKGHIKECHGDLHLANIALYEDKPVIFDCLEFSDKLRWIDTICDIAFLIMDFESHGHPSLAYHFLNDYLEYNGDYKGLKLLRFYCVYRALVRAKIYAIEFNNEKTTARRNELQHQYQSYITLALNYTKPDSPFILITHGFSGSGKTTLTRPIMEKLGAIRIRSDIERKRLNHLNQFQSSSSNLTGGIYTKDKSDKVYQHLADISEQIIKSGYPVIIDASFLVKKYRILFKEQAFRLNIPFIILDFEAPEANLIERIEERKKQATDASEADISVLKYQIKHSVPLDNTEKEHSIFINTNTEVNYEGMISLIKTKLLD
jgi:hypothetical protein